MRMPLSMISEENFQEYLKQILERDDDKRGIVLSFSPYRLPLLQTREGTREILHTLALQLKDEYPDIRIEIIKEEV